MYVAVGEDGSWKVVNPALDLSNKNGKEKKKRTNILLNYAISLKGLY